LDRIVTMFLPTAVFHVLTPRMYANKRPSDNTIRARCLVPIQWCSRLWITSAYRGSPPRRCPPPHLCRTASAASLRDPEEEPAALEGGVGIGVRVEPQFVLEDRDTFVAEKSLLKVRGVRSGFERLRCVGACSGRYVERNHLSLYIRNHSLASGSNMVMYQR